MKYVLKQKHKNRSVRSKNTHAVVPYSISDTTLADFGSDGFNAVKTLPARLTAHNSVSG
jgi:hypothetical protein